MTSRSTAARGGPALCLASGALTLDLRPGLGGSVASFRRGGVDVFRPLAEAEAEAEDIAPNVVDTGMFPMVPYANRIPGNLFHYAGRDYRLKANNPPERFNVHGTGWHRPWQVAEAGADAARLVLEDATEAHAYRAEQIFALDGAGLSVELGLTNLGPDPMPFGFGLHPWFPRDADMRLGFAATQFYPEGPDMVALDPVPLPETLDFTAPRPLPDHWLNNDFGGWGGRADLAFPGRGHTLRISADPVFRHLMIYADPARKVFCVEPQSNAPGAFTRPGGYDDPAEGVFVLAPGEAAAGRVRFDVTPL